MRYDQINLNRQVSIPDGAGGTEVFPSAPASSVGNYSLGFGKKPVIQEGRAGHLDIQPDGAAQIINLLSCAAVVYIYTDVLGNVQNVVLYHAHTGLIPNHELPTDPTHNAHRVSNAQIHVVVASSQSMEDDPDEGIQTAAYGLIDILQAGVPKANVRVLTGTTACFGANVRGEVGIYARATWANGDLQATLTNVAAQALADYETQFGPGQTKLGFLGSGHNLANGRTRIQTFRDTLSAARDDTARLNALETLLQDAHPFKAGSLKLFVVQRLYGAVRNLPITNVTAQNAQHEGNAILNGIRDGTL